MKEVITLQIGNYANYVGSHFWNIQDELAGLDENSLEGKFKNEINNDLLFRTCEINNEVIYTPRLVLFDIKGSLGAVNPDTGFCEAKNFYSAESSIHSWNGQSAIYKSKPIEKNKFLLSLEEEEREEDEEEEGEKERKINFNSYHQNAEELRKKQKINGGRMNGIDFQKTETEKQKIKEKQKEVEEIQKEKEKMEDLEKNVNHFTDYLKLKLHPKSFCLFNENCFMDESKQSYGYGKEVFGNNTEINEEMNEKIRFFAEECDHIQGFQIFIDENHGFYSSMAANILQEINHEYSRLPSFSFVLNSTSDSSYPKSSSSSLLMNNLSDCVSFHDISSFSSLYFPLQLPSLSNDLFPHLSINNKKKYHTSAIFSASIDSITLPFRLCSNEHNFSRTLFSNSLDNAVGGIEMHNFNSLLKQNSFCDVVYTTMAFPSPPLLSSTNPHLFSSMASLTPNLNLNSNINSSSSPSPEMIVHRGVDIERKGQVIPLSDHRDHLLSSLISENRPTRICHLALSHMPLPLPLPFPPIFKPEVTRYGKINPEPNPEPMPSQTSVLSVPALTRIGTGQPLASFFRDKVDRFGKLGLGRRSAGSALLKSWGIAPEEAEEISENLQKYLPTSKFGSEGDSDFDD